MKLTTKEIESIAKLARLELDEKEKVRYAEQLSVVLDYVEQLNEVNTDDVSETCQVTGLEDVIREDKVIASEEDKRQKLVAMFPEKIGNLLKVKKVFSD